MEKLLRLKQLFKKKKPTSEEDLVQHGTPLGFTEIHVKDTAIKSVGGVIDSANPEVAERIRENYLGKEIGLTRRIFKGEVDGWVWPVVGGLVGIVAIAGLVVIEKKYRKEENLKNLLEKVGITKEDVLGKERYGVRERLSLLLRFSRR